jgi:hypothetical protein
MGRRTIYFFILFIFAGLFGCSDVIVTDSDENYCVADFESAWNTVKTVYPYFQFKQINWDSIHSVYLPRAEKAQGDEIDAILLDMLKELKDGHVSLQTQGVAFISTYHPPRIQKDRYAYNPLVVRNYFDRELLLSGNGRIEYEIVQGNIGYIYVSTMRKEDPVLDGFDEALAFVKETKGLIIDVRHNGGGSDYNSWGIIGRLIASSIDGLPYPLPGGGLGRGGLINPRGPFQYTKSVVMLINGVCFSSCEDFAKVMKHVSTVTAVGDTTGGGSGAPQSFTLPSGRVIAVSTKDFRRYDGDRIEWNGILPDIRIAQTSEDINQGRDKQLEYAIELLR